MARLCAALLSPDEDLFNRQTVGVSCFLLQGLLGKWSRRKAQGPSKSFHSKSGKWLQIRNSGHQSRIWTEVLQFPLPYRSTDPPSEQTWRSWCRYFWTCFCWTVFSLFSLHTGRLINPLLSIFSAPWLFLIMQSVKLMNSRSEAPGGLTA